MKKEDISKVIEMILASLNDESESQNCEQCNAVGKIHCPKSDWGDRLPITTEDCINYLMKLVTDLAERIVLLEEYVKQKENLINALYVDNNIIPCIVCEGDGKIHYYDNNEIRNCSFCKGSRIVSLREANNYYYESESNKKSLANKVEALMWENIELRKNISK